MRERTKIRVIRGFAVYFVVAAIGALLVAQNPFSAVLGVILAVGFFAWANDRQE